MDLFHYYRNCVLYLTRLFFDQINIVIPRDLTFFFYSLLLNKLILTSKENTINQTYMAAMNERNPLGATTIFVSNNLSKGNSVF